MTNFADFLHALNGDLESLQQSVNHLAHIDDVFWQMQAILKANTEFKEDGAVFQNWMAFCYADSMAIGLRRLVDTDSRTQSIYRLLEKLKPRSAEFSRTWYLSLHQQTMREDADKWFTNLVGGPHERLTVDVIEEKQADLRKSLKSVSDFADQFVAHFDLSPVAKPPSFDNARDSIVAAFRVVQWLSSIIASVGLLSPVPKIQSNWLRNFQVPWIKPGQTPPPYVHLDELLKRRVVSRRKDFRRPES